MIALRSAPLYLYTLLPLIKKKKQLIHWSHPECSCLSPDKQAVVERCIWIRALPPARTRRRQTPSHRDRNTGHTVLDRLASSSLEMLLIRTRKKEQQKLHMTLIRSWEGVQKKVSCYCNTSDSESIFCSTFNYCLINWV